MRPGTWLNGQCRVFVLVVMMAVYCEIDGKEVLMHPTHTDEEYLRMSGIVSKIAIREFTRLMREIFGGDTGVYDPEEAHAKADKLMCDQLRRFGFGEAVDIFERADLWYS